MEGKTEAKSIEKRELASGDPTLVPLVKYVKKKGGGEKPAFLTAERKEMEASGDGNHVSLPNAQFRVLFLFISSIFFVLNSFFAFVFLLPLEIRQNKPQF